MLVLFSSYAGRATAAAASTGYKQKHLLELKILLDESMSF
jgi:hypothetical protein